MFSTVPFPRVYGSWEKLLFLILFLAFTFLTLSVSEKMWGHFGICYYFLLLLKGLNNMHNVGGVKPAKHNLTMIAIMMRMKALKWSHTSARMTRLIFFFFAALFRR